MEYLDILYSFCSKDSDAMAELVDADVKFRELIFEISKKPKVGYFLKPSLYLSPEMRLEFINISYVDGVPFIVISHNRYSSTFELHFRTKKTFFKGDVLEAYFLGHSSLVEEYNMSATLSKDLYNAYKKWLGNDIRVQGYKLGDVANSIYLTMVKLEKELAFKFADRSSTFIINGFIEYGGIKFYSFEVKTGAYHFKIEPKVLSGQLVLSTSTIGNSKNKGFTQDIYYNLQR